MPIQSPPLPFWSVWMYLSTWERLFLVSLGMLSIYTLFSAIATTSRILKIKASTLKRSDLDVQNTLAVLRRRSARLQKLIATAFYFFGIVLFFSLERAHITLGDSKIPVGFQVLQNFYVDFIFAFNAFVFFLLLHVLSWFVENCLERFGMQ